MLTKKDLIKGDRLRDLMLLVHLNNRYGMGTKMDDSRLAEFLHYSRTGLSTAIKESGFFEEKGDEITLSEKGERYVRAELLPSYRAVNPIGYFLIFLGSLLFVQWYLVSYYRTLLVFHWSSGPAVIVFGLFVRFALLPTRYWVLKILKKV